MARRSIAAAVFSGLVLVGTLPLTASAATPPLPGSIAAVGDSITQAASSGGSLGADYPQNSWSTGTNSTVNSHYRRLLALNPAISGRAWNYSVSGAKAADLKGQMLGVAPLHPDYLTLLIGGNDLCTPTVSQMTSVATFRSQLTQAMDTLTAGSAGTNVFVASIPNAYHLWELFHANWWARTIWSVGDICQSLLANPTSTQAADVQRRAEVAQRNVDFNSVLAQVCSLYVRCLFDGNAVFNTQFTTSDVAGDYFHPSLSGQTKLAAGTWPVSFWANGGPGTNNTVHLASASGSGTARKGGWTATVTVSARDGNGSVVSGAAVGGTWSTGGTGSCVTAASGSCSFSLNVARKTTSVSWTVASVTAVGRTYDAASNSGTPVVISAP